MYHPHGGRVASAGTEFQAAIGEVCRLIRESSPTLTEAESQLLSDYQRGRYEMKTLRTLLDIAARCGGAAAAALPEALHGYVLRTSTAHLLSVSESFRLEQTTQGKGDVEQMRYLEDRSEGRRAAAIEALLAQAVATRRALDALHATRAG